MDGAKFAIEASEVESMVNESGLSVLQLLTSFVKPAQNLARPPISKFSVGAVGLGSDGRIFFGVNLEFPGLPLHHSVHAEQFLATNLAVHGEPRLLYIAVSAAPCGHCRQFLQELRNASDIQIFITSSSSSSSENESQEPPKFKPLSSILPNPFGPFDLLDKETPLLLEPHDNGLWLLSETIDSNSGNSSNLSNGFCELFAKNESMLKISALEAANNSHALYSGCPSGVALMDVEGMIYRGSYTESAAYNPSLGPVQAALVSYVASGGGGYGRIVAGVLVEKKEAVVRQEDTARLLLKAVSPKCELRVFHCGSGLNGCKRPS